MPVTSSEIATPKRAPPVAVAPTTSSKKGASLKHLSGEVISYPMVSRVDLAPVSSGQQQSAGVKSATGPAQLKKSRPPPIKVATTNHSSFLTPLKNRFSKSGREKDISPDREATDGDDARSIHSRKSKVDLLIAETSAPPSEVDDTLDITLPSRTSDTSQAPAHSAPLASTGIALGSPFHDPSSSGSCTEVSAMPALRPAHRRGTSDESPQIVQDAFARVAELEGVRARPTTMFSAGTITPGLGNSTRRPSAAMSLAARAERAKSVSSATLAAKLDDAFFAPSVGAPSAPVTPAMSRRPSQAPRVLDTVNSVGISVREGSTGLREVARAAMPASDGLAVSLRSYHRPEDLEASLVCLPCVDEEGRPFTTWEIRLVPRSISAAPAVPPLPTAVTAPPAPKENTARARTPSTSHFHNYRMSAPPLPSAGAVDPSGMFPPNASAPSSGSRRGTQDSLPPRKLSARSEGSSYGGSFSSDVSMFGMGRKHGKLSVSSVATTVPDSIPPFDLETMLAKNQQLDSDGLPFGLTGRQRTNRSSSYAHGSDSSHRSRQFSIDEENIMGRAASFSVGPGVAHQPKSPRHHRFGCYIPPVSQSGGAEFARLAQQAKRASTAAGGEAGIVEGEEEEILQTQSTPSPASRVRKQSIAAGTAEGHDLPRLESAVKGFQASRAGRRKQSVAAPPSLVIPPPPHTTGTGVSPSSGGMQSSTSPARTARADVFGEFRTPTKAQHVAALRSASTPPPTLPLPDLPSDTGASVDSDSSFGAGEPGDLDDSEVDPVELEDVENASIRLATARQAQRMASHWSESEEDDGNESESAAGHTSWSKVPDASPSEE
ncbi:hypothetical protein Rhopal_006995-T1 [Rhodotorula paludigena]|uniref:Proteophosphoglycan ppg4 n=1 Tax=Rhodotorula paludigena TaxID=86838 RepID=A0AAV5GNM4_9BASI|nr:hypothetical protein Rhopal_006995-T1 [Rhodotorula paludigena]